MMIDGSGACEGGEPSLSGPCRGPAPLPGGGRLGCNIREWEAFAISGEDRYADHGEPFRELEANGMASDRHGPRGGTERVARQSRLKV